MRWVVAAMETELDLLKQAGQAETVPGFPFPVHIGTIGGRNVGLAALGIGVVSASLRLGQLQSELRGAEVIMVGSAGSLPDSGLMKGDLALARSEWLAELGVLTGPGTADVRLLGLPGLEQSISFDAGLTSRVQNAASGTTRVVEGPFLTVLSPSADAGQAHARGSFFHAVAENMEGFALAHAACAIGFRAAELRGISNLAGDRDKRRWDLMPAQRLAQAAVLNHLEGPS